MQRVAEEDIHIVRDVTSEMWDQMRELMRTVPWTTQDEAVWQLLPEMKNILPVFAIRKSDTYVLGGLAMVVTDILYGAFYVMRSNFRGQGIGMKLTYELTELVRGFAEMKPVLGRGGKSLADQQKIPLFHHAVMNVPIL
ncbi:hypothetical protein RB195_025379 [Necator americanus]|uniref:N-acetyltransferase domain-containing protein n=1 Tax=Necator americanus TaxID=51031 RepID=A0ABR1ESN8_NECAM